MKKKKLTDFELREKKEKVTAGVKDVDSSDVGIRNRDVDDRDEGTGGVSFTEADTRESGKRNLDQRENVNRTGALDDIPIDEESEDEFELVGEGNQNKNYDTTGNNIIMSHSSVNENSETNITLKKERMIELEKKTIRLSIFNLEMKLLKLF